MNGQFSTGMGEAYTYLLSGTTWSLESTAVGPDTTSGDGFGNSVATADGTDANPTILVVGAPNHTVGGAGGAGAAYVFQLETSGLWGTAPAELFEPVVGGGDQFGFAVAALSATQIVIGAPGTSAAYVYTYSGTSWSLSATYQSCPVSIGENMATWGTLLVTGKTSDVVIDTSVVNPASGCGGN